ncbi:MAG TPA: response regulator [Steroidobacteraceae bacterium]|nr:response regulator [Steroidobacteraceae bacterium]
MSDSKFKVLCVDDEPRVLDSLRRHLQDTYEVLTAASGAEGLDVLKTHRDVAVVVSDMRMPAMDGATFLRHTRVLRPSSVRVLLTGQADMAAAIKAINEGQIFRFLTKPCAPDQFLSMIGEAIRQYELVAAERLLLQRTLVGAIKALTDIMTLVSPAIVGRAQRLRRRVAALATELRFEEHWQVETAALLSHLGEVSLPDSLTHKIAHGTELDEDEAQRLREATRAANRLINHVPRLEAVSAILNALGDPATAADPGIATRPDSTHVEVLRLAMDAERLESQGLRGPAVLEALQASGDYSPSLLSALEATQLEQSEVLTRTEIPLSALTVGMVLDQDVVTSRQVLIAPRGCEVTPSFIEHLRHFAKQLPQSKVTVLLSSSTAQEATGQRAAREARTS